MCCVQHCILSVCIFCEATRDADPTWNMSIQLHTTWDLVFVNSSSSGLTEAAALFTSVFSY